jgi:hypothetical protein
VRGSVVESASYQNRCQSLEGGRTRKRSETRTTSCMSQASIDLASKRSDKRCAHGPQLSEQKSVLKQVDEGEKRRALRNLEKGGRNAKGSGGEGGGRLFRLDVAQCTQSARTTTNSKAKQGLSALSMPTSAYTALATSVLNVASNTPFSFAVTACAARVDGSRSNHPFPSVQDRLRAGGVCGLQGAGYELVEALCSFPKGATHCSWGAHVA